MRSRRWIRATGALMALVLLGAACNDSGESGSGGDSLKGEIAADGSSTVGPITAAVAEEFGAEEPGVQVAVSISGTGGGFERFCRGETDLQDASRAIKDEEKAACEDEGIEWLELQVAHDGIAIVVNKDVTWIDCTSLEQLKTVWDDGSTVGRWSDLDPKFPDEALTLFGPGTDSGTFDYFTDAVNGEEGKVRRVFTPSEDDNVLVKGVSEQKGAMGYFGLGYFEENESRLKALSVKGADGACVTPDVETVQSGAYPLARPLFLYVKKSSLERPEVKAFLDFYLDSMGGLVQGIGYVPLLDDELAETRAAYDAAVG